MHAWIYTSRARSPGRVWFSCSVLWLIRPFHPKFWPLLSLAKTCSFVLIKWVIIIDWFKIDMLSAFFSPPFFFLFRHKPFSLQWMVSCPGPLWARLKDAWCWLGANERFRLSVCGAKWQCEKPVIAAATAGRQAGRQDRATRAAPIREPWKEGPNQEVMAHSTITHAQNRTV